MRVLLASNKIKDSENLETFLKNIDYKVDMATSIEDSRYYANARQYDLALLGICTHYSSILELLNIIRDKNHKAKIIILMERQNNYYDNEAKFFKDGADDVVYYPIYPEALLARIQTRLKASMTGIIEIGNLIIDVYDQKISYKGEQVDIKGKPFEVLLYLIHHKDQIVSKEQILDAIWQEPEFVTPNVIEVAINQIRHRLDKPLKIQTIETIRRRGYRFCYSED